MSNKLTLNINKSSYMLLSSNAKINLSCDSELKIDNTILNRVDKTNFLGVLIDQHMSWKSHIEQLCGKISRLCGILTRAKHVLYSHTLMLLYNSLIKPHFIYCNIVWGNSFKTYLHKLHLVQKRIIRIITRSEFHAHTAPILEKYQIMNIYQLTDYFSALFIYKSLNLKLPESFCNLFSKNINNRTSHNLRIPYHKKKLSEHSILIAGPRIWNNLPTNCKQSGSLNVFKKSLKQILFSNTT